MLLTEKDVEDIKCFYGNTYYRFSFLYLLQMVRRHCSSYKGTFYVSMKYDYDER